MNTIQYRILGLLCSVLLLSACVAPQDPEEVAEAFWASVIHHNTDGVLEYSTLTDAGDYDRFSRDDWAGREVSLGTRLIKDETAQIVTTAASSGQSDAVDLEFSTYLVRSGGRWRVDYERTASSVRMSSAIGDMFGEIERFSRELSEQVETASRQLNADMRELAERLREFSESVRRQTSESIEFYGERLRGHIEELERSIERALRERQDDMSERDRRILREAASDLQDSREPLANPSAQAVADSGETVAATQKRLDEVDREVFGPYQEEWQRKAAMIEADMERLVGELSR